MLTSLLGSPGRCSGDGTSAAMPGAMVVGANCRCVNWEGWFSCLGDGLLANSECLLNVPTLPAKGWFGRFGSQVSPGDSSGDCARASDELFGTQCQVLQHLGVDDWCGEAVKPQLGGHRWILRMFVPCFTC